MQNIMHYWQEKKDLVPYTHSFPVEESTYLVSNSFSQLCIALFNSIPSYLYISLNIV